MNSDLLEGGCGGFEGSRSFHDELRSVPAECPSGALEGVSTHLIYNDGRIPMGVNPSNFSFETGGPIRITEAFEVGSLCGQDPMDIGEDEVSRRQNLDCLNFSSCGLGCVFDEGCSSKAGDWFFVRTNHPFPWVLQCLVFINVLVVATSSAFCADELLQDLRASLQRRHPIRRLYFWPPLNTGRLCKTFLRICCIGLLCFLEMAEDDLAYTEAIGGVHILQGYFYCVVGTYLFLEVCAYMRVREESHPRFPARCCFRAGRRTEQRRRKSWTKRKIVALFLLINLSAAEAVSVSSAARRASFGLADENTSNAFSMSQQMPDVDDVFSRSSHSAYSGLQEASMVCPVLSQGDSIVGMTPLPPVLLRDNLAASCAPIGYHTDRVLCMTFVHILR